MTKPPGWQQWSPVVRCVTYVEAKLKGLTDRFHVCEGERKRGAKDGS